VWQAAIDIGGDTTDFYVAQKQTPRPTYCRSIKKGVGAASDRFAEKYRQTYGQTLSLEARQSLLWQHVNQEAYRTVRDREFQVVPDTQVATLIEAALREVGAEIAAEAAAAWDSILPDLDQILVVGGGAYYYLADIQARIRHARRAPYKPEMANAIGYCVLAERLAKVQKVGRK
jgi:hypothetical protein